MNFTALSGKVTRMLKNKLQQLFRDNEANGGGFRAELKDDEATLYLYEPIGGWFGVDAKDFATELKDIKASTIHLRINSPGGDVFDGRAIATALSQCKAKVIAHVDGVCASAATYVALACDEVEMADGAFFMIHQAWTLAIGNADDLMQTAELLLKVDDSIVNDYAKKTGLNDTELKEMMAAETWLTAEEALEKGFIDSIYESEEGVENSWNLSAYDNAPDNLKAQTNKDVEKETEIVYDRARYERRLALM